jgi:hypothetical protein
MFSPLGSLQGTLAFIPFCAQPEGQPEVTDWYLLPSSVFPAHATTFPHSFYIRINVSVSKVCFCYLFPFKIPSRITEMLLASIILVVTNKLEILDKINKSFKNKNSLGHIQINLKI